MPKVLEMNGFRFSFYSNENQELPHIHITKGKGNAKYWLEPEIAEEYAYEFKLKERRDIKNLVYEHYDFLLNKWYEHFNQ